MTESPAVFRNARHEVCLVAFERRLAELELRQVGLCEGLALMLSALSALGTFIGAQNEMLPGEQKLAIEARHH